MFVILVGAVTFNSWPHAGDLFRHGDAALNANSTSAPAPAPRPKTLNLVRLLGGGPAVSTHRGGGQRGAPIENGSLPGSIGGSRGGSNGPSPGSGGGQGPVSTPAPPPPPPPTQARSLLSRTVSGAGNTLQSDTESLGGTVNTATGTNVGDVVSGLGSTVNSNLQGLAGRLNGR